MLRSKSLFVAAEELEDDELEDGVDEEAVEVPGEVRDAEDEVEDTQDVIDDSSDDVERLEDIKDILEDAAEKGEGIDETAAKVVEVAVESIYARLGIRETNVIGATEGFSNVRTRVTATKLAAEAIGETISRAWEAVKKFFKDLWAKIKELWARYATAVGRLKGKAESIRKKLNRAPDNKKETEFDNKSFAKAFKGKDSKALILGTQLDNTLKELADIEAMRTEIVTALDSKDGLTAERLKTIAKTSSGDSLVMVANKKVEVKQYAGKDEVADFEVAIKDDEPKDPDETMSVEDKSALIAHCTKIVKICDKILEISKKDKDYTRMIKAIDKLAKEKSKGKETADKSEAETIKMTRVYLKVNGKLGYIPQRAVIAGCHKALSYVAKCASYYKSED